jgi:hypothetical protein
VFGDEFELSSRASVGFAAEEEEGTALLFSVVVVEVPVETVEELIRLALTTNEPLPTTNTFGACGGAAGDGLETTTTGVKESGVRDGDGDGHGELTVLTGPTWGGLRLTMSERLFLTTPLPG